MGARGSAGYALEQRAATDKCIPRLQILSLQIAFGDPALRDKAATLDRRKPVLVHCAGGIKSHKAVGVLKEPGFETIQHLHRGYGSR